MLSDPRLGPDLIIMDPVTGTCPELYLSTGMRLLLYSVLWLADFDTVSQFAIHTLAYLRISLLEYKKDSTSEKAIIGLQLSTDSLIRTMGVAWDDSIDIGHAADSLLPTMLIHEQLQLRLSTEKPALLIRAVHGSLNGVTIMLRTTNLPEALQQMGSHLILDQCLLQQMGR